MIINIRDTIFKFSLKGVVARKSRTLATVICKIQVGSKTIYGHAIGEGTCVGLYYTD